MGWNRPGWLIYLAFIGLVVPTVHSISRGELFPFGLRTRDEILESGSDRTHRLELDKPVLFYDGPIKNIYINTNGFVATEQPSAESTYLSKMPPSFGMIAALQGDLVTGGSTAKVYFRQDTSFATLQKAAEHINRAFPAGDEVEPTHCVVVTWLDMAPLEEEARYGLPDKTNTYQLVIASMETVSYAILLYPRDGIQFASTPIRDSSQTMHAGFSKGTVKGYIFSSQGPYYRITTEDESSVRALSEETNSGRRGVWVYEIGTSPTFSKIVPGEVTDLPTEPPGQRAHGGQQRVEDPPYEPEDSHGGQVLVHNVQFRPHQPQYPPEDPQVLEVEDGDIDVDVFSYNFETCAIGRKKCSTFADCKDYSTGYCCHCRPGFYGNGIQCVAEGKPQRMNGKVSGRVYVGNSQSAVEFSSKDLHSYVVANDGRAYVAISDIPASLGPSFQPLSALGGVIGWAFALEQPGFKNGFSIIGGEFTRQAEVTFQPNNERLTIKQEFKGIDEHDHLVVSTTLEGRLPEVHRGSTVQVDPYSEIYQYSSNMITSSSTRDYVVSLEDGSTVTRSYQWRQTITFKSCQHDEASRAILPTQMLRVDQIFVMYDANNELMRYAMSNKIGDISGVQAEENPCFTGRHGCDTNAACRPGQGTQFTCECAAGFRGDGRSCHDIDECRETPQVCGSHAICNNQPGTFRCECLDGYQFGNDGQTCIEVNRPVDHCSAGTHNCDIPERAHCSYTGGSFFICSCLTGFIGDGRNCQDIDECQQGRCHQEAVCYNSQGSFTCQCKPGFYGDGFYCSSEQTKTQCETHRESILGSTEFGPRGPRPVGQFIPTCDEQGAYEATQCHGSTGNCWCVDRNGQEIPGTLSGPGSRPMCIDQTVVRPPVGPSPRPDVYPLPPGTNLLFAQSGRIEYVPLEGYDMKKTEAKAVLHLPEKIIIGVAYDCVEKMVYWTDITAPSISKANLKGGEPIAVIRSDLESPEGIAIDYLSRTMFWTDSMKDRIEVASLDGSQRRVIIDSDLVNPRAIIADPLNGKLYWSDWNRDAPKIESSHMDGSNRRALVKKGLGLPNGLTYDPQNSLLCWADAGTHKMECMNPAQGDRRTIMEGIQYPFGMAFHGKNVYYTDWRRDAVVAVDRFAGRETEEFQPQKRTRLYGIVTAYAQCPTGQNYCSVNNGGCTHLCLATPSGRSCLCPDNAVGVSCVDREGRF